MDASLQFGLIRLVKFGAILVYAMGVGVGLGALELPNRKQAVHLLASPALIVVWLAGNGLTLYTGVAPTELWVVMGFLASLGAHLMLVQVTRKQVVSRNHRLTVLLFLSATLAFMVFRPTWGSLRS